MKLRLRANTIRLRLTRSEVEAAGCGRTIVDITQFAGGETFEVALAPGTGPDLAAGFDGQRLTVSAPLALLTAWAGNDRVALAEPASGPGPSILVEKDFQCLSPRPGDDDNDTFAHPRAGSEVC